ncbi:hypothetical protein PDJAM_G00120510, partial [Pangasius djambal]|nr:hypothetical protein [Pangasius djambal]
RCSSLYCSNTSSTPGNLSSSAPSLNMRGENKGSRSRSSAPLSLQPRHNAERSGLQLSTARLLSFFYTLSIAFFFIFLRLCTPLSIFVPSAEHELCSRIREIIHPELCFPQCAWKSSGISQVSGCAHRRGSPTLTRF